MVNTLRAVEVSLYVYGEHPKSVGGFFLCVVLMFANFDKWGILSVRGAMHASVVFVKLNLRLIKP